MVGVFNRLRRIRYATVVLTRRIAMLIGYNWSDAFTIGIEVSVYETGPGDRRWQASFQRRRNNDAIGREVFS